MATTMAGVNLSAPRIAAKSGVEPPKPHAFIRIQPWSFNKRLTHGRMMVVRPVMAAPDKLSDKVAESVKNAEDACSENPASGECVAAWDEVEELSAAASHARDKQKSSDALEEYCKDNPEADECRTYED
ncbi:hypothetical protein TIFTF001_021457 [Ficus carica]|uniref:CP12 domain-containing protein n=1 Tax=Ficus carica TaxID=3494 RepID=A0AA88AFZ3_FICCA|nr:hypothetical protein TIFTF001_021457 [Ficus carica]